MKLNQVHPAEEKTSSDSPSVEVRFSLQGDMLLADFDVSHENQIPFVNAGLSTAESQWGIWDWDVVEVFVKANSADAYCEFIVSPLNQYFELEIFEPRKRFNRDFASGFEHEVRSLGPGHWKAQMRIPLAALSWDGKAESIQGNAFAIFGKDSEATHRTYFSLFLPKQDSPDFHLPQYFRELL